MAEVPIGDVGRCISIPSAGGYDKLRIRGIGCPVRGFNVEEDTPVVTIRVTAFGVNYADVCIRWGIYKSAKEYVGWPITPGFEVAGIVESAPAGSRFSEGDRVMAVTAFGGYSTLLDVPEHQVFPIPQGWSDSEAASILTVYLTAYYALFELAKPRKGSTVLIHSAAGGVGSLLVKLCKLEGLSVIGVVGKRSKVSYAARCGCDVVIDKSNENLWETAAAAAPEGYSVIFDANGVSTLKQSYNHLAPTGRLITYGFHSMLPRKGGKISIWGWLKLGWDVLRTPRFDPMDLTSSNKSVMGFNLSFLFSQTYILKEAMSRFSKWVEAGKLTPPTVTQVRFEDIAKAHAALESGNTIGKQVVLTGTKPHGRRMRSPMKRTFGDDEDEDSGDEGEARVEHEEKEDASGERGGEEEEEEEGEEEEEEEAAERSSNKPTRVQPVRRSKRHFARKRRRV